MMQISAELKKKVIEYLKSAKVVAAAAGHVYDHVVDDYSREALLAYEDGQYEWTSEEIYHFEKYDEPLDEALLIHAVKMVQGNR